MSLRWFSCLFFKAFSKVVGGMSSGDVGKLAMFPVSGCGGTGGLVNCLMMFVSLMCCMAPPFVGCRCCDLQAHASGNDTVEPVILCATITFAADEAPARDVLKLLFCHPLTMTAGANE